MTPEHVKWGILGLLVGDALGVPYEFTKPQAIPDLKDIEYQPPKGFKRAHDVPPGTWSDDGSQALCVLDAILSAPEDEPIESAVASRLLRWRHEGFMAVDGRVFDIGITTNNALTRVAAGVSPSQAGMRGERTLSNGSLMRVLPVVLYCDNDRIARAAMGQSRVTHAETEVLLCCALYALWAKYVSLGHPRAWEEAASQLHEVVPKGILSANIMWVKGWNGKLTGSGHVLDSLHSAKAAVDAGRDYESTVKRAIQFGNDTDTTAAIAGGIAGIKYRRIPERWIDGLRGKELLEPILERLREWTIT